MLKRIIIITLVFLLSFSLCGCDSSTNSIKNENDFDEWTIELIDILLGSDSPNFNQLFIHPEDIGIEKTTINWPTYSILNNQEFNNKCNQAYEELLNYNYDSLSDDQKETYDFLKWTLEPTSDEFVDKFYYLSSNVLGAYTGVLANPVITLYYFNINDLMDVKNFINLVDTLDEYANNLVAFENERQDQGYGMTDEEVKMSIDNIQRSLQVADFNFIIDSFIEKINKTDLEKTTKDAYISEVNNKVNEALNNYYLIALEGLKSLEIKQKSGVTLFDLDGGKEYYKQLIYAYTGFDDIDEYKKYVASLVTKTANQYVNLLSKDIDITKPFYETNDPNEVITYLSEAIKNDFPQTEEVQFEMIQAPKALTSLMGGTVAFYLIGALDNQDLMQQMVLVEDYTDKSFSTIAHEGYPGHMYQHIYDAKENNTAYIVNILGNSGYSEGYANYVERYSAKYATNSDVAEVYAILNSFSTLNLIMADYMMHFEGDIDGAKELISSIMGVSKDSELLSPILKQLQFSPAIFTQYYISGYLIEQMHDDLIEESGKDISDLEFHTALLSHGPLPLPILKEYLLKDFGVS